MSKKLKKKSSWMKQIFLLILTMMLLAIAGIVVAGTMFVMKVSSDLPTSEEMMTYRINLPSIIYDRNNVVIAKLFTENRNPLELKNISPWLVKAVLAAEDSDFYSHRGISITGIARALWVDIMQKFHGGGGLQGGSTITQQLARNLFLSHERSIVRKVKEIIIAFRLEEIYSKDKILEMYLNTIYFGRGAWGIDTAAHTYFGKNASDLTVSEASILAGIIPAPNRYNPLTNLVSAKERQNYVLGRMGTLGWLDSAQIERTKKEELVFKHTPNKVEEFIRGHYFVSQVLFGELLPKYGAEKVYGGGMEIFTTVDIRLQEKAQEIMSAQKYQGALAAIEPSTGEVMALIGGKDYKQSKFNRATQAYRQPGSSFKPFIYGAAIDNGLRPSDHFIDDKLEFKSGKTTWRPGNYDGKFHGEVTMLYALTKSLNTVPVRCIAYMGPEAAVDFARKTGMTSPYLPKDLSLALGSASVTPMEMALAFSVFANSGKRVEKPVMIREVRSWTGEVLEKNEYNFVQAISPETSWTILSMLFDAVTSGTGGRAKIPKVQVFGKTGTTNDFIDAWFIGGIPGLVASVYIGRDDNKTIGRGMTGGVVSAPPWKEFMAFASATLGLKPQFDPPSASVNVSQVAVCRTTGFLSTGGCPSVSLYLKKGTAPTTKCPVHGGDGSYADAKAPRLIKIAQDGDFISQYGENDTHLEVPFEPVQPKPLQDINQPPPVVTPPINSLEDKYQKLLKDYGIQ